jgi:hypothetical protein
MVDDLPIFGYHEKQIPLGPNGERRRVLGGIPFGHLFPRAERASPTRMNQGKGKGIFLKFCKKLPKSLSVAREDMAISGIPGDFPIPIGKGVTNECMLSASQECFGHFT